MDQRNDDDDTAFLQFENLPPLSRAAFQLHGFAVLNSIKDGHPGFVSDDYLNAIAAETTTIALGLQAAGMWDPRDGGYFIVEDEIVKIAIDINEESERRRAACAARGEHRLLEESRSEWAICADCGTPLQRPDGGPIALPRSGPLWPDRRADRS